MPGIATEIGVIARRQRTRRMLAIGVGAVGVFDIVTAVLPPPKDQLDFIERVAPIAISQTAAALIALCGLLLLALVRGIRRGQRQAWVISGVVLAFAALLHLAKGLEGIQSAISLLLLAALVVKRSDFTATVDRRSRWSGFALLILSVGVTVLLTAISLEGFLLLDPDSVGISPLRALVAVTERLVGLHTVPLPHRLDSFLSPTLLGLGLFLSFLVIIVISRPVVDRRLHTGKVSRIEARDLVDRHGSGTLDYFALRYDKQHYFAGETLVTYAVHGGVCLVSPDPIGPPEKRAEAWGEFCRFADTHGWVVAVLGAEATWLTTYRSTGMRYMYIGDEAVVSLSKFDLAGGHKKGLRQAVGRIARYGYRVSFHDPRHLDASLARSLHEMTAQSRRGSHERGFSMTLGRMFDPDDANLLLAVAHSPEGVPVAFCQFVPAPGIDGYSLDLMRRDEGDHPNGLIDFLIVSTIEHLRNRGMSNLGLNFAAMRAVLAGETGNTVTARVQRVILRKLSRSMQIESLWYFTAKYDPEWVGRYLAFSSFEHLLPVGYAVARAESFWELPLVGRYMRPDRRRAQAASSIEEPEAA